MSGAEPTDVAGRPAYTVRVGPKEGGSLFAGAELSFDADNGTPLRAALYSSASSSPVLELAATEISYGPVPESVFSITPPSNVKVEEVKLGTTTPARTSTPRAPAAVASPKVQHPRPRAGDDRGAAEQDQGRRRERRPRKACPRSHRRNDRPASCAPSSGTLLSFERSGVRYLLAGSVSPAAVEAVARGL